MKNQKAEANNGKRQRGLPPATGSAAILDYPNEAGWWWAWAANAKRWYLISITTDDLDVENVPHNYEVWTKCVPPLPPNARTELPKESR